MMLRPIQRRRVPARLIADLDRGEDVQGDVGAVHAGDAGGFAGEDMEPRIAARFDRHVGEGAAEEIEVVFEIVAERGFSARQPTR